MKLYYHPVSSYSQKTLVAVHEKNAPVTTEIVDLFDQAKKDEFKKIYPLGKLPVLVLDDGHIIPESSIVIEYLDGKFDTGTRLVPTDRERARQARFYDRIFDLYVNNQFQKIFFDARRPENLRDSLGVKTAMETLEISYGMLDKHFAKNTWALGDDFSIADCAAAPSLGYARMVAPLDKYPNVASYLGRLVERPSYQKVFAEAQPYLAKLAK